MTPWFIGKARLFHTSHSFPNLFETYLLFVGCVNGWLDVERVCVLALCSPCSVGCVVWVHVCEKHSNMFILWHLRIAFMSIKSNFPLKHVSRSPCLYKHIILCGQVHMQVLNEFDTIDTPTYNISTKMHSNITLRFLGIHARQFIVIFPQWRKGFWIRSIIKREETIYIFFESTFTRLIKSLTNVYLNYLFPPNY
jgi:hypothetical protein